MSKERHRWNERVMIGRRRKVRPGVQLAARQSIVWVLLGVMVLGTCAGACLHTLHRHVGRTPYDQHPHQHSAGGGPINPTPF